MRTWLLGAPRWVLSLWNGVSFGGFMAVAGVLRGDSWPAALIGGAISGLVFGAIMGPVTHRLHGRLRQAVGPVPADVERAARKATWRGPAPADPEVRSVALRLIDFQLAESHRRRTFTLSSLALFSAGYVLAALLWSAWWWAAAVFFGGMLVLAGAHARAPAPSRRPPAEGRRPVRLRRFDRPAGDHRMTKARRRWRWAVAPLIGVATGIYAGGVQQAVSGLWGEPWDWAEMAFFVALWAVVMPPVWRLVLRAVEAGRLPRSPAARARRRQSQLVRPAMAAGALPSSVEPDLWRRALDGEVKEWRDQRWVAGISAVLVPGLIGVAAVVANDNDWRVWAVAVVVAAEALAAFRWSGDRLRTARRLRAELPSDD